MKLNFFNYIGGKYYMINEIIPLLDYSKECFIELFGGSGKVLLNKYPHNIEIFNDINDEIFNLWMVIKYKHEQLANEIENVLYCEKIFFHYLNMDYDSIETDVEKAVRTLVILNFGFNSSNSNSFSYSYTREKMSNILYKKSMFDLISNRIKHVQILNRSYENILENIKNKKDICVYADPPYFGTEYYYRNCSFKKEDHYKLAEYFNNANYSVLLSYYEFPEIETLYPKSKWNYKYIEKPVFSIYNKNLNNKNYKIELLLYNYETKPYTLELFNQSM